MKEEKAILPIIAGIVFAMVASHITPWDHPHTDTASFVLLFASVGSILAGTYMYCQMIARLTMQTIEIEEFGD